MPELINYHQFVREALERNILGAKISSIKHQHRYKTNGELPATRGTNLDRFCNILFYGKSEKNITVTAIGSRGSQLGIEVEWHDDEQGTEKFSLLWSLSLGSAFCWIKKDQLNLFPFHVEHENKGFCRTNTIIEFENSDLIWVVIDCRTCYNLPTWKIKGASLTDSSIWNNQAPDILLEPEEWLNYIVLKTSKGPFKARSLTKLLSSDIYFDGIGASMLSEVLHRLNKVSSSLKPWTWVYRDEHKTIHPKGIFSILQQVIRVYAEENHIFEKKWSIFTHNRTKLKQYYYHHLEAYRKPESRFFRIGGPDGKLKVYTQLEGNPNKENRKIKDFLSEKWIQQDCHPLTIDGLGVGPDAWHTTLDETKLLLNSLEAIELPSEVLQAHPYTVSGPLFFLSSISSSKSSTAISSPNSNIPTSSSSPLDSTLSSIIDSFSSTTTTISSPLSSNSNKKKNKRKRPNKITRSKKRADLKLLQIQQQISN